MSALAEPLSGGMDLRRNAIGLVAAATMGAIMMSPALGIYSWFPAISATTGMIVPLVFVIALVVSLPTALSYSLVSRVRPSAGSAYTWVSEVAGGRIGTWLGLVLALYYLGVVATMPVQFALYWNEFLAYFGLSTGYATFAIGVLLSSAAVALLSYPDIRVSVKAALVFMLFEGLVVTALAITVGVVHAGELSTAPLNPGNSSGGTTSIFAALIFGVLAFTGYDAATTVAEETHTPRRLIPIAVMSALILTAVFWIVTSYLLSFAATGAEVAKYVSEGVTPFGPISQQYWGIGTLLVDVTGMTASIGVFIAATVGISRILYAMGRDRVLPSWFAWIHPVHKTPWNAMHVLFVLAIVLNLAGAAILGIYNFLLWIGSATVWFALIAYMFVNVANLRLHWTKFRSEFNWLWNGIVPAFGVVVCLYLIYSGFFVAYWNIADFATGKGVVIISVAVTVLAAGYAAIWVRNGRGMAPPTTAADPQVDQR